MVTNTDNIAFEDDEFHLIHQPDVQIIKQLIEESGEFLRDKVTIIIEDEDCMFLHIVYFILFLQPKFPQNHYYILLRMCTQL